MPRFLGSSQDISALLDVILVTVRFVGLSGNTSREKVQNIILKCVIIVRNLTCRQKRKIKCRYGFTKIIS